VTQDDLLYRFRLRTFAMAAELGNVRAACRAMGIHPSTYYRWKHQLDRYGPEILRPRERRTPRMANATSPLVEQRVVAFALGHPGFGPARIAAELARPKWGGIFGCPHNTGSSTVAALVCSPARPALTSQITIYGWSISRPVSWSLLAVGPPDCDPIATPLAGTRNTAATPATPSPNNDAANPDLGTASSRCR
jgi:hypothetical protein